MTDINAMPERCIADLRRNPIKKRRNLIGKIALVANFPKRPHNRQPVDIAIEGQQMFVPKAMIIGKMCGLQPLSDNPQSFALVISHQICMAEIPAYLYAVIVERIHKIQQILHRCCIGALNRRGIKHIFNDDAHSVLKRQFKIWRKVRKVALLGRLMGISLGLRFRRRMNGHPLDAKHA